MGAFLYIKHKLLDFAIRLRRYFIALRVALGCLKVTDNQVDMFDYKGWRFSYLAQSPKLLDALEDFDDFDNSDFDVVVFTFPKTGTHFLCDVIHSIYYATGLLPNQRDSVLDAIYFELSPNPTGLHVESHLKSLRNARKPRIISTHLPWSFLPAKVKQNKVKLIHVMRNPKDAACSAVPFYKKAGVLLRNTSMDQFIDLFTTGRLICGDYMKYIREWYPHRNDPNTMYLYYEDMKQDLPSCVRRIAEFLNVSLTDKQILDISAANSFSSIKKKTFTNFIHRTGKAGGWMNELTVAQNEVMDEWISRGMEGLDEIKFTYEL